MVMELNGSRSSSNVNRQVHEGELGRPRLCDTPGAFPGVKQSRVGGLWMFFLDCFVVRKACTPRNDETFLGCFVGKKRLLATTAPRKDVASFIFTFPIRLYQLCISGFLPNCCRFEPTCSTYAIKAIKLHGAWRGMVLATKRVCRCHPWQPGGIDPVP